MKKKEKQPQQPQYLLDGKPYTKSVATDISMTFRKYGWVPPSEVKHDRNA